MTFAATRDYGFPFDSRMFMARPGLRTRPELLYGQSGERCSAVQFGLVGSVQVKLLRTRAQARRLDYHPRPPPRPHPSAVSPVHRLHSLPYRLSPPALESEVHGGNEPRRPVARYLADIQQAGKVKCGFSLP